MREHDDISQVIIKISLKIADFTREVPQKNNLLKIVLNQPDISESHITNKIEPYKRHFGQE